MAKYKKPRGQPRAFRSAAHLFERMQEFCDDIIEHGYNVLPSKTEFCRWYANHYKRSISRRTLWSAMELYYPEIKEDVTELIGDVLAQGAALGHWNATVTIFVLKNWCHWGDKPPSENTHGGAAEGNEVKFTFEVVNKVEAADE